MADVTNSFTCPLALAVCGFVSHYNSYATTLFLHWGPLPVIRCVILMQTSYGFIYFLLSTAETF